MANANVKPATAYTKNWNKEQKRKADPVYIEEEKRYYQTAKQHLLLSLLEKEEGEDLWTAPDDVNPYLWQHQQTNHIAGIFSLSGKEVVMAGGVDIATILFVKSKTGWVIVDAGASVEAARYCMELAEKVSAEVDGFVAVLSRKEIIQKSLDNYGYILVADSLDDAIETVNMIASEHLEIVTKNPFEAMMKVRNAGAIFLGEYSSEPLGDYFAGPNHVLPTNGTAKFFSALSVDDFVKKSSIVYYSREALRKIHKDIEQFATSEQLTAHANSIAVRFEDEEQ